MKFKKKIYFENLKITNNKILNEVKKNVNKVLYSGNYILGSNVLKFENSFKKYLGAKYVLGVGNGLDALTIAFLSLNLKPKSEVIVASNSYIACILSIINAGLKPVLVEPDETSYNINVKKIFNKINKNTKAILALHLYGKPCDVIEIKKICEKYNLYLVEDCAQSHGSKILNKKTGTFGDFGCFSFYPTKNLGAFGDAGAIVCKNKNFYEKVLRMRNYGSKNRYENEILGINSRLDEVQAAILNIKIKYLDKINNHKREIAELYDKYLDKKFIKPARLKNFHDVFYIYNIRHPKRDKIKNKLMDLNIQTDIHYPKPPFKQKSVSNFFKGEKYPIAEKISSSTLSLPISFGHTKDEIFKVIEALNRMKI